MTELAQYTADELKLIRSVFVSGVMPVCPRCLTRMTERPIGGGSFGLGYARKREWLICPNCHRSAIYDIKRGTRN
ncbi:MAG TPA: hypothetical protein VHM24_07060 [Gemmatimonadaceae bacterium]|nr:hypothetical protein [Gemmatimonadaceae bacterium]